jgi:ribosomal protein L7/L12
MSKVETILEEIKGLTLLEASDLVKKMEEAFGVSAAAATVVAARRLRRRRRRNSPSFSPMWAATRSTSLRPSAKSPASA